MARRTRFQADAAEGWTSLIGLHWIDPGSHYLGSDADNGIRLAMGPAHLGLLHMKSGRMRFVPERGAAVTVDGHRYNQEPTLRSTTIPPARASSASMKAKAWRR